MDAVKKMIVEKLIQVRGSALANSERELAAIAALGRVGGVDAVQHLLAIVKVALANSPRELAALAALGEAGRVD